MSRLRPLFLLCTAALLPAVLRALPEPPLPELDVPDAPAHKPFELIPKSKAPQPDGEMPLPDGASDLPADQIEGDVPVFEDPIEPAPEVDAFQRLQEIEAPGAPSDGEPLPEMPHVPGLILPSFRPPAAPASGGDTLPDGQPGDGLLPPAAVLPGVELAAKARWVRSPYEAMRMARKEQKAVLVFFAQLLNGAGPSAQLNDDLLALPEFNEFAASRLVCTKLQYPTSMKAQGNITQERLNVLSLVQQKYKVRGFPVLLLLDENGRELERISGYSRVKSLSDGVTYSTGHSLLDRLKEAEKRCSERRQFKQEKQERLATQGYRSWVSTHGSSLMAKLVRAEPNEITLMDENGSWRAVHPSQLRLYDSEWAFRKQAGLIPEKPAAQETAAADPGTGQVP